MFEMWSPSSFPVSLLVLALVLPSSSAVFCSQCKGPEMDLNICSHFRPITEGGTSDHSQPETIPFSDLLISPAVFSTQAQQSLLSKPFSTVSKSQSCAICGKICKNSHGLKIHIARMHKAAIQAAAQNTSSPQETTTPPSTVSSGSQNNPLQDRKKTIHYNRHSWLEGMRYNLPRLNQ